MSDAAGFVTNRTRILAVLWVIVMSGLMALLGYAGSAGEVLEERVFRLLIGGMAGGFLAWCGIAVLITRTTRVTRSRQAGG
jgi:hypothetical protein